MLLLQGVQRLQRLLLFCQLITTARGDQTPVTSSAAFSSATCGSNCAYER